MQKNFLTHKDVHYRQFSQRLVSHSLKVPTETIGQQVPSVSINLCFSQSLIWKKHTTGLPILNTEQPPQLQITLVTATSDKLQVLMTMCLILNLAMEASLNAL